MIFDWRLPSWRNCSPNFLVPIHHLVLDAWRPSAFESPSRNLIMTTWASPALLQLLVIAPTHAQEYPWQLGTSGPCGDFRAILFGLRNVAQTFQHFMDETTLLLQLHRLHLRLCWNGLRSTGLCQCVQESLWSVRAGCPGSSHGCNQDTLHLPHLPPSIFVPPLARHCHPQPLRVSQ